MPLPIPKRVPERGFYYHYKHDPKGDVGNYAYEVVGTGLHTEDRNYVVIYRPLYKNTFLDNADYCVRPHDMFVGNLDIEGKTLPRFAKIVDPKVIEKLEKIKREMY